jgi:hypothetical protein
VIGSWPEAESPDRSRRWVLGGARRVQLSPLSPFPPLEELVKALHEELESPADEQPIDPPTRLSA